jgi:cysteine desulfuration protein SufE
MPGPDQTSSTQPHKALPKLEDLLANFEVIEDWEERYRYLIEIGRDLPPMPEADKTEANRVRGYAGESDAHIVRGLVALTLAIFSGKTAQAILATDPFPVFDALGLSQHLTPQRSNGVRSMVERIRNDARGAV